MSDPRPDPEVAHLRVPPHSVEAEQSVLGGLMLDNGGWDRFGDVLTDTDFYGFQHRLIFSAIGQLINANRPADVITVYERLQRNDKGAECGGMPYLNSLAQSVPSAANIRRYAEIVRERSILRKLVAASDEIATTAFNAGDKTAADVLDLAQRLVMQVAAEGPQTDDDWEANDKGIVRLIDHISEVAAGNVKPDIIPTGFAELDEKLNGGPRPGEVVTIGMRSGMGKSALAVNILTNGAEAGEPGGMLSMEMPRAQVHMRMLSARSKIHLTRLKRPERLRDADWGNLSEAVDFVSSLPIHISDKAGLNINQIRARARALKRKLGGRLRILVLDHLALTRGTDPKTLRTYQLQEVTSGLKGLAKELGCVVYLLVQINRATDARPDAMPTLADIRDTSSVEDDSDIVIFGHREYKAKPDLSEEWVRYAEIAIAKQRDGDLCRLPLTFIGENVLFESWPADVPVPKNKVRTRGDL